MEFVTSTGLAGVALLNAACVLNAGFRTYQALRRRHAALLQREHGADGRRHAAGTAMRLPSVPALPQLSSEDDQDDQDEAEDAFVELASSSAAGSSSSSSASSTSSSAAYPTSTLNGIMHWLYYWSAFAFLRFLQIHVSEQFGYLLLMINVAVLFSPAGARLSKTLFDIGVVPVMGVVEVNIAPHAARGAVFFHSAFSQCVRGVHTEVAKVSIPYASEGQLQEIENHCTKMARLLQVERRRRRVAEWSDSQSSFAQDGGRGGGGRSKASRDAVSASGGLRRRKQKSRPRVKGIRQSLGLW